MACASFARRLWCCSAMGGTGVDLEWPTADGLGESLSTHGHFSPGEYVVFAAKVPSTWVFGLGLGYVGIMTAIILNLSMATIPFISWIILSRAASWRSVSGFTTDRHFHFAKLLREPCVTSKPLHPT